MKKPVILLLLLAIAQSGHAFSSIRRPSLKTTKLASAAATAEVLPNNNQSWKDLFSSELQSRPLAFNTKYGALNPFGIFYGLTSIILGLVWYAGIQSCRLFYLLTGNRFDKNKRLPIFFGHVWGVLLMRLTNCYPKIYNKEIIDELYKKHKAAMFVANHRSWMDIPFLGAAIGWRNYKMVAKKELLKVPILGAAIDIAGHVSVGRGDRKSQIQTLKSGINWMKKGVNLVTFPEGTRSKTGNLLPFKNGAFKMAYKAGCPIVPVSIVGAAQCMPLGWMFPVIPGRRCAKVIIHEPVETTELSEQEVADKVRQAIQSALPDADI